MCGMGEKGTPGPEKSQSFLCFTLSIRWWNVMVGFKQEEERILRYAIFVFFTQRAVFQGVPLSFGPQGAVFLQAYVQVLLCDALDVY